MIVVVVCWKSEATNFSIGYLVANPIVIKGEEKSNSIHNGEHVVVDENAVRHPEQTINGHAQKRYGRNGLSNNSWSSFWCLLRCFECLSEHFPSKSCWELWRYDSNHGAIKTAMVNNVPTKDKAVSYVSVVGILSIISWLATGPWLSGRGLRLRLRF